MLTLKDFNVTRKTATLSNGTRVILFERPNAPISMYIAFIAGSRFDKPGKEGTAHFLEHVLMSGNKAFPTREKMGEFIENLGASNNAFTSRDILCLSMHIAEIEDLQKAINFLSGVISESLFEEKSIETERGVILQEQASKVNRPAGMLSEISSQLLFQNTAVERSVIGTPESIRNISKQDMLSFCAEYINGNNCTIEASGGVEIEKLTAILENELKMQTKNRPMLDSDLPIFRNRYTAFHNFHNKDITLVLEFRIPNKVDPDRRPLAILASILGGGRTSRLTRSLRYDSGLAYSVSAYIDTWADRGLFGVHTSIVRNNLEKAMGIICTEIKNIKRNGPTEEELALVKNRIFKSRKRAMQTSEDWLDFHFETDVYYPNLNWTVVDFLKEVEAVTIEDVKRVANKYLTNYNWYLSATGDVDEELINRTKIDL